LNESSSSIETPVKVKRKDIPSCDPVSFTERAAAFTHHFLRLLALTIAVYLVVKVFLHLRDDIGRMESKEIATIDREIQECTLNYIKNECEPELRREALEQYCKE
jgi:Di-sulfide bridge nucleocytoplasmic transport domain